MTPPANPPVPSIPEACAVLSVKEMFAADNAAAAGGIGTLSLMEAAGTAIARAQPRPRQHERQAEKR